MEIFLILPVARVVKIEVLKDLISGEDQYLTYRWPHVTGTNRLLYEAGGGSCHFLSRGPTLFMKVPLL